LDRQPDGPEPAGGVARNVSAGSRSSQRPTLTAYRADPHIAAVPYLVTDPAVGDIIKQAAANLGHSDATHAQPAQFGKHAPAETRNLGTGGLRRSV
jgi:hypothetical protein